MPGKQAFERKLEAVAALRGAPPEEASAQLKKALKDLSNYLVSKAATVAGDLRLAALLPDLLAAFDRFMEDPVKTDPQCWAKNAIVKALKDLNYQEPEVYLRGMEHVQMEAVWGGVADTAVTLRGACALALVACSLDRETILTRMVDRLVDQAGPVRVDAITALGQLPGPDTVLLLRLRALSADKEPAVAGRCFDVLLELVPQESIPFVQRFLSGKDPDLQSEAVGALAGSRHMAAAELLIPVIERDRPELAAAAVAGLGHSRFREDFRPRVEAAVRRRDLAALSEAFRSSFDPEPS